MLARLKDLIRGGQFTAPALILVGLFSFWPLFLGFRLALYRSDGLGLETYVGLANFVEIFKDPVFSRACRTMGVFLLLNVPLQTLGPLLGAKLIHGLRSSRIAYVFRVIFVLPLVVPGMVSILLWSNLYAGDGAINHLLSAVGLQDLARPWLGDSGTAIYAIVCSGIPWIGGISLLIYLAALKNVPRGQYEAAMLDGANEWAVFRQIEIPALLPQIRIVSVLSCIGVIQNYENIMVMTNGGPGNATLVPALYMFNNAFAFGNLGYAAAIGILLFLACLILSVVNLVLSRKA